MYALGIVLGMLLLAAKYGSFYLLTGGETQWTVPFTNGKGVRDWVYSSPVRTGLLDMAAGYVGMHALIAFGGSIISMIAMCTYIITCMSVIFSTILIKKATNKMKLGLFKQGGLKYV
jgi:hypothetical protein